MMATELTELEIRRSGWDALCRDLGVVDAARYVRQFEAGAGNWTEERRELFKHETVEGIVAKMPEERTRRDA